MSAVLKRSLSQRFHAPASHHGARSLQLIMDYASFSSLLWFRATTADGRIRPHRWRWKQYQIWGTGCTDDDQRGQDCDGGIWRTSIDSQTYRSQSDARAAVEIYDLSQAGPVVSMDDVDQVWEACNDVTAVSFEALMAATGFDAGKLSDLIARGYEVGIIRVDITAGVGYRRETRRR